MKPFFNELERLVNNTEQNSQSSQNITNKSKNHSSSELYNEILQLERNAKRISNKSIKETQEAIQKSRLTSNNQVGEGKPTFITKKFTKNKYKKNIKHKTNIKNNKINNIVNKSRKILQLKTSDFKNTNKNFEHLDTRLQNLLTKYKYLKKIFDEQKRIPKNYILNEYNKFNLL